MSIGSRFRKCLLALALLLALGLPAHAGLNEVYTCQGLLGTLQYPQITVVNSSGVVPIFLPQGYTLPKEYQVGRQVWVEIEKASMGTWKLRRIRLLQTPTQPLPSQPLHVR